MAINLFTQHIKVFLCDTNTSEALKHKERLKIVLTKAGIEILEYQTEDNLEEKIKQADCTIHILDSTDIYSDKQQSLAHKEYSISKQLREQGLKMFIWNPDNINEQYINNIRREIIENTIYSTKHSPIVFVEELRGIMNIKNAAQQEILQRDIFFIYNDLDKSTASDILNMVEDIQTVIKLGISMNRDTDYTEYIKNQLQGCKIGIIYFDYALDWALSFARQIWKDSGGQSCKTPLLLIGNSEHAKQEQLETLSNVMETSINDISLIPLDIKVFFDKSIQ